MTFLAILGRQPELSLAELEAVYGSAQQLGSSAALVETSSIDIQTLGGTQKAGPIVLTIESGNWEDIRREILAHYTKTWKNLEGKQTLGISFYDSPKISSRDIHSLSLNLKTALKKYGVSLRTIPNQDRALSTATSHHNKLGLSPKKTELLIARHGRTTYVAESTGSQNITALATRDQGRPKRDAFVGMLPPKLAQLMINLATGGVHENKTLLDPFCGTGVLLQEALLMGHSVYGTDLAEKMIRYSEENLAWIQSKQHFKGSWRLHEGDATSTVWEKPIDVVATEAYLGQPFSAPPSAKKLQEVRGNCNHIISSFLTNIRPQLQDGTRLCIAVPAWRDTAGKFTHLPLIAQLNELGYTLQHPAHALLYHRPDQVVARELLVLIALPK